MQYCYMASVFPIVLCLVLSFLNAATTARELPSSDLAHQVKFQSLKGNTIKNVTWVSERPFLPGLSNVQPDTIVGNKNLQYAVMMSEVTDYFLGAKGALAVYGLPDVEEGQTSSAVIWVSNYDPKNVTTQNVVQAGWHVRPSLYGDTHTHLFISWTTDNYQTPSCYNLDCPGFILHNDPPKKPGDVLTKLSTPGGDQHSITIRIHKEKSDGNWWLYYAEDDNSEAAVGYWPMDLFDSLKEKATFIEFGGVVEYPLGYTGPPMGSGHSSRDWANHQSADFHDLQFLYKGSDYEDMTPQWLSEYASQKDCYDVTELKDYDGNLLVYYGGPPGCPSD